MMPFAMFSGVGTDPKILDWREQRRRWARRNWSSRDRANERWTTKIVPGDVGQAASQENKRFEEKSTRTTLV
jgi:hypothetical protein